MTSATIKAAVVPHSDNKISWHKIDWAKCHRHVRKLQARIAKAVKEKRWRAVQRLQRLLTRSKAAKFVAVKRVTENRGKNTPGVDNIVWKTPGAKYKAALSLDSEGYRPQPLRRVYIKKSNNKLRPLGIPTMTDRSHQAVHKLALDPIAEVRADGNSYGFRLYRSTADAIQQCFVILSRKTSAQWVLEADVRGCFDNISHEWVENNIPMDKKTLHKWLKAGFMENKSFHKTKSGTPQGGVISPTLMNMTLDGLEAEIRSKFPVRRGTVMNKVHYVRYADDFIVTGDSKTVLEEEVKPLIENFLKKRGLELSQEKTKITHINEGFDFLGQNIRKYNGKLLTKPSLKSQKSFRLKVKEVMKTLKAKSQEEVIGKLNPIIRGWGNYHSHIVSKKVFGSMDYYVWKKVWRWALRRHPNKAKRWIYNRYFASEGTRNWIFRACKEVVKGKIRFTKKPCNKQGRIKPYPSLINMMDIPIRRHVKIRSNANPYDPQWKRYFKKRPYSKIRDPQK